MKENPRQPLDSLEKLKLLVEQLQEKTPDFLLTIAIKSKYVTKHFVLPIAQMQIEKKIICVWFTFL